MSPTLIKALLILFIVYGFESIALAVATTFSRKLRPLAIKSLVRGAFALVVFLPALSLFNRGFFRDDFSFLALFLGHAVVSVGIEMIFARSIRAVISPENAKLPVRPMSKRQFLLIATLGVVWFLAPPVIVFKIFAPEVMAIYVWLFLVGCALFGFILVAWHRRQMIKASDPASAPSPE
jgi:hypothetical protein